MKDLRKKRLLKRGLAVVVLVFLSAGVAFYSLPPKGYIPVLMYHFVTPEVADQNNSLFVSQQAFDRQMWFLKAFGFRPISARQFDRILSGDEKAKGREVLITFDDGHETFASYALPILERHQVPAVNFLIWDHVVQGKALGGMSLEEVLMLKSHPLIIFGSHTITHPDLTGLNPDQARFEISESKEKLEKALEQPIDYFCYPAGVMNEKVMKLVQEGGYRLAFTTAWKSLKGSAQTRYSITRTKIGSRDNLMTFWFKISGLKQLVYGRLTPNLMNDKLNSY